MKWASLSWRPANLILSLVCTGKEEEGREKRREEKRREEKRREEKRREAKGPVSEINYAEGRERAKINQGIQAV